ncbi:MAG: hypothetical protein J5629_00075 [Muribaculaceae bacterium]|nr:hypothetical protein [Muribaculaceae bacterium]
MKKIFSIFAIAALATMIMVSCETKKDSSKSSFDTEEVSTSEVSASEEGEEVAIEDLKELTCDNYTLTVPEGWKASSRMVRSSCNLTLKENPHTTAMVNHTLYSENDLAESIKKRGGKPISDISVDGNTFKVFEAEKDGRYEYEAFVPQGDGFVTFRVMPGGTPMKGAELKVVMMKNLNDIIAATALK